MNSFHQGGCTLQESLRGIISKHPFLIIFSFLHPTLDFTQLTFFTTPTPGDFTKMYKNSQILNIRMLLHTQAVCMVKTNIEFITAWKRMPSSEAEWPTSHQPHNPHGRIKKCPPGGLPAHEAVFPATAKTLAEQGHTLCPMQWCCRDFLPSLEPCHFVQGPLYKTRRLQD